MSRTHKELADYDEDGEWLLGCCDELTRIIHICNDVSELTMIDTPYELVHACHVSSPMSGAAQTAYDREENVVLFSAEAAFEILRNATSAWYG